MKTVVEFRSDKFPPFDGEEQQLNPGLWGRRLAEYLQARLHEQGCETDPIIAEDWGWMVPVRHEALPLWIGCGHQYGDEDQFLCFVEPAKPFIRRWFKKIDTQADVSRLVDALDSILQNDPDITDIGWVDT